MTQVPLQCLPDFLLLSLEVNLILVKLLCQGLSIFICLPILLRCNQLVYVRDLLVNVLDVPSNLILQRFDHGQFLPNRLELDLMEITYLFEEECLERIKGTL